MQLTGRSLLIESVQSDLPLRGHNYEVCYAIVRSPHPRCSAGIQSMSQSAAAATRPESIFRGTRSCIIHAQHAIIHNFGQDCWMVTCQGIE